MSAAQRSLPNALAQLRNVQAALSERQVEQFFR